MREADWVVCELSSFQLEDVHLFACAVAVLLNLEPDHLDRYASFEDYRDAKLRIFERARAKVVPRGFGLEGIEFAADDPLPAEPRIRGAHNRENAAAATAAARAAGIGDDAIAEALRTFPGVPHRLEDVGEAAGVRFVNDSKATNVAAARRALAAYEDEPVHLILGGSLKGESFAPLAGAIGPNVRSVHLVGAGRDRARRRDPGRARRRHARPRGRARRGGGERGRRRPAQPGVRELRPVRELRGARRGLPPSRGRAGGAVVSRFRREVQEGEEARATSLELFFDLVFVFAVTQVSHILLERPDLARRGPDAARAGGRLVGVELHDLGHERARPGLDDRPAARCSG